MLKEFKDFPTYKANYIKAFEKMIEVRKKRGLENKWKTGQEVFDWWIGKDKYVCRGQMELSEFFKM